jgi:hypothetical protein
MTWLGHREVAAMRLPFLSRCDEVTRALAAPGAPGAEGPGLDCDAVAEHLAACPRCADWVARNAALTGLWEATRPAEPSDAAWDALWSRGAARLDAPRAPDVEPEVAAEPDVLPFLPVSRGRLVARLFVAAQAAAILAAAVLWAARRPAPAPDLPEAGLMVRTVALRAEVEAEPGEILIIRDEGQSLRPDKVTQDDRSNTLDPYWAALNDLEDFAMAD